MHVTEKSIDFLDSFGGVESVKFKMKSPETGFEKYSIPDIVTFDKCKAMVLELKRKHPQMKHERIARKVAEFYKLKPKDTNEHPQ